MAERIPDKESEAAFQVDHNAFFEDTYRLLTIFLASQPIASLDLGDLSRHPNRPINKWALFGVREVANLLLRLAATIRAKDDDGTWLTRPNAVVGELINDLEQKSIVVGLTIREACNKVLHSKRVHLDVDRHETTGAEYINPIVFLYGEHGKRRWRASLDIVAFCSEAQNIIC